MKEHRDEKGRHAPAQSKMARRMRGEGMKKKEEKKVHRSIEEFEHGKLHSGSKKGPKVKSKAQAIAIGYSEAKRDKKKK